MSSSYLTSTDLRMISGLLRENPASGTDVSRQTEARLLIYAFQDGFWEEEMRSLLAHFRTIKQLLNSPAEIERLARTLSASDNQEPKDDSSPLYAAIGAFLDLNQKEAPFVPEISAVRRIFPNLELGDADLLNAIMREASANGFTAEGNVLQPEGLRASIDRWDNEGGAPEEVSHSQDHWKGTVDPAKVPQFAERDIHSGSGRAGIGESLLPAGQSS